jgi:hypothetical protein
MVVTFVPVTSSIARVYPFQVLLRAADTGLQQDSKAQVEQVRAVAVQRLGARLGPVPPAAMADLDEALRLRRLVVLLDEALCRPVELVELFGHDRLDHVEIDPKVLVCDQVAESDHVRPRDL